MSGTAAFHFEIYRRRRGELLAVAARQQEIAETLRLDEMGEQENKPAAFVRELIARLESDRLKVLVVGVFNAGKSTFLNALFGKLILPSSPLPTTGVVCEISYAPPGQEKAVLYPKPGRGREHGDEPFEVKISDLRRELERYVRIQHFAGDEETSRYRKMELHWPLDLCREGVELVDSVGLDDPQSRDEITLDYAKSADAILYCMSAEFACAGRDIMTLELLKTLGYESILFILTHYDVILRSIAMGETTEEEFRRTMTGNLASRTQLGAGGIKYLDSQSALLGRRNGDEVLIERSGILDVESSLARFLTQEKGTAKLLTSLRALHRVNGIVSKTIPGRIGMWNTSTGELERRYREAEMPLRMLDENRRLIMRSIDVAFADVARSAGDLAAAYFLELPSKIESWADAYQLSSVGFPPTKSSIKPVAEEMAAHLTVCIETEVARWNRDVLSPAIQSAVNEAQADLEEKARKLFQQLDEIRIRISVGAINRDAITDKTNVSVVSRIIAGTYTILTGDILTGGVGLTLGLPAMLKTIVMQVVGIVIVAILGLFNPVGIVAAVVAATLAGTSWNLFSLKKKIKEVVARELANALTEKYDVLCTSVRAAVETELTKLRTVIDKGLSGEIAGVRGEVEDMLKQRNAGQADAAREIEILESLGRANDRLRQELDELVQEARFTDPGSGSTEIHPGLADAVNA